ncbi:MAG: erythromycin esterase family protein [Oceanipulchritudo sp.]
MILLREPTLKAIEDGAEPFLNQEEADLSPLLERIGEKRLVLIGEASHGTSEFYRMRQRITQKLIEEKGFNLVAAEADWPDSEHVDDYVRLRDGKAERPREAFSRFPLWMWRNTEVLSFMEWLRGHNRSVSAPRRVSFHGLDLYSLYTSLHEVLEYLEREEPEAVNQALERYRSLLAFEPEEADYARAVAQVDAGSADEVAAMLRDLLEKRLKAPRETRETIFDAEQNARVVAHAEAYYRTMFTGGRNTWNLRDSHMLETLQNVMKVRADGQSRAVVWAHNSHVGDARATQMGQRGEHNLGQLARQAFGEEDCHLIGFGTHEGTVAAADNWGEPVQIKQVRPSLNGSFERVCHEAEPENFILPLRGAVASQIHEAGNFLERAIGVIYRPESERFSHYFQAAIDKQFDEYIWFERSRAVSPITAEVAPDMPEDHPFAFKD